MTMPRRHTSFLLATCLVAAACGTLEIGIERTPTPTSLPAPASDASLSPTDRPLDAATATPARPTVAASPATNTPTSLPAPTHTATSLPARPRLIRPAAGAVLPQPVPPQGWDFIWDARTGPCRSSLVVEGPGGRRIESGPLALALSYSYSSPDYLPADSLGPWTWYVKLSCPAGDVRSDPRTFWVEPAPTPSASPTATATPSPTATASPTATVSPFALPDLVVAGMFVEMQGRTGNCVIAFTPYGISAMVRNLGAADAGPFAVDVNGARQQISSGLAAGQSITVWFAGTAPNGLNLAMVDPSGLVPESNENNNAQSYVSVTPTPPPLCTPTPTVTPTPIR